MFHVKIKFFPMKMNKGGFFSVISNYLTKYRMLPRASTKSKVNFNEKLWHSCEACAKLIFSLTASHISWHY